MTKSYIDKDGKKHTEYYDKKDNLTESIIRYTDNDGNLRVEHYDGKEKLVRYTIESKKKQKRVKSIMGVPTGIDAIEEKIPDGIEIKEVITNELQPKKGFKTVEHSLYWTDGKGVEHEVRERGKERTHTTRYTDEKGIKHSETRDWDGKLLGKSEQILNPHNVTERVWDAKGKLLHKFVAVDFIDKKVFITPDQKKGKLSRLVRRLLEGKAGDVESIIIEPERKKVNTKLKGILKESALNDKEKRTKLRETVAEYREKYGKESDRYKAPNKKVGEALKKCLPTKERR